MFFGFGEKESTRFRKKKGKKGKKKEKEKKQRKKKLIVAKSGLVGMKGYLKTYNRLKYFLPYSGRFLIRPLFTPNFPYGYWVLKLKSGNVLP